MSPTQLVEYTFAVIIDKQDTFLMWKMDKFGKRSLTGQNLDRFVVNNILYIPISKDYHLRGYRIHGVIFTDKAKLNKDYDKIINMIPISMEQ